MFVIPTINCSDRRCVDGCLKTVHEIGADFVQFDVADGTLTPDWTTWNDPRTLHNIPYPVSFEAHLMVRTPRDFAENWLEAGAKRIIFHIESEFRIGELERMAHLHHARLAVALNPETPLEALRDAPGVSEVLLLGVVPGKSGQTFRRETLAKARELLALRPDVTIELDGGITPSVAREAREIGVRDVAVGAYIFESADPKAAYEELEEMGDRGN